MTPFERAYSLTRGFEGGFANSPSDRGGPTIFGISSKYWPEDFSKVKGLVDSGELEQADALTKDFYKRNFWDAIRGDDLDPKAATVLFDTAVNHGLKPAQDLYQKTGGNPQALLESRKGLYQQIAQNDPTQAPNIEGWNNRVEQLGAAINEPQYADAGNIATDATVDGFTKEQLQAIAIAEAKMKMAEQAKKPSRQKMTDAQSAFAGAGQVGSLNFGDEIIGALDATVSTPLLELAQVAGLTDKEPEWADIYSRRQKKISGEADQAYQDNPLAYLAGGVGGAAITYPLALRSLATVAPQATAQALKYAKANPWKASMVAGSTGGALGGFGEGQTLAERASGTSRGALEGLGLGPLGKGAGDLLMGAGKSALSMFSKSPKVAPVDELTRISESMAQRGEIFPKTQGQRTQLPESQRAEALAKSGNLGEPAEEAVRQAETLQNRSFYKFMDEVSGGKDVDINNAIDNVTSVVKGRADKMAGEVDSAYKVAKTSGKGVSISSDDIKQGLWAKIGDIKENGGGGGGYVLDIKGMEGARGVLKDLAKRSQRRPKLDPKKAIAPTASNRVDLKELEAWRTLVTNMANDAKVQGRGTEANFLREVRDGYDDFMRQTAADAVDLGDKDAILAFRDAVSKRAEYGKLFESNKVVDDIISGNQSVDDTVKTLMATGSLKGKRDMANTLNALLKASGPDADAVKADLQAAFAKKAIERAEKNMEIGGDIKALSPAKLAKELKDIFENQSQFAESLYGKDTVSRAKQAIKELELIASEQSQVRSTANTAETLGRMLARSRVGQIPGFNIITGSLEDAVKNGQGKEVIKGLSDFMPQQKPSSSIWRGATAPVAAGVSAQERNQ